MKVIPWHTAYGSPLGEVWVHILINNSQFSIKNSLEEKLDPGHFLPM